MKINQIRKILKENNTKFFSVEFIKKDGTLRKLNGNIRYVPGHNGENTVKHKSEYVTVVLSSKDVKGNNQWRNVNLETVRKLTIGGKSFTWA